MPRLPAIALFALLNMPGLSAATAPMDIFLTNGETVRGVIVSETEEVVVVERSVPGRNGSIIAKMTYLRSRIIKMVPAPIEEDPTFAYLKRAKGAPDTPEAHLDLARFCVDRKLVSEAVAHLDKVVKARPHDPSALRLLAELGAMEVDGTWIAEKDFLAQQDLSREGGKVVATEEKGQGRERANAIIIANRLEARLAAHHKEIDKAKERIAVIPGAQREARSTASLAETQAQQARANEQRERDRIIELSRNIDDAARYYSQDNQRLWRTERQAAERRIHEYQRQNTEALARKATAERELTKLEREWAEVRPRLAKLEVELPALAEETATAVAARTAANAAAKGQ